MKFIQKLCFSGETEEALEEYKKAFGCTIKNLLHYSDAVKNGWERPDEKRNHWCIIPRLCLGNRR